MTFPNNLNNSLAYLYYAFKSGIDDPDEILHYYFGCTVYTDTVEKLVLDNKFSNIQLLTKLSSLYQEINDSNKAILTKYLDYIFNSYKPNE
jgi:hypothetical protein